MSNVKFDRQLIFDNIIGQKVDSDGQGGFETRTLTEYLVDKNNHTGYEQVLQETVKNADTGEIQKKVIYTIGQDVISQTTIDYVAGVAQTPVTLVFGYDGHGSTRVLTDMAAAIATVSGVRQIFNYDAYGNAIGFNPSQAATTLLYSGEQFDALTGLGYNRARYYNPATATWNRLDPFAGNSRDPQSLHKYLYGNADPISFIDPTGEFGLGGLAVGMSIGGSIRTTGTEVYLAIFDSVVATVRGVQAGQSFWQIFSGFLLDELIGFGIGVAIGKVIKIGGDLWNNGIIIAPANSSRRAGRAAKRPFAVMHNARLRFPRSKAAHAPRPARQVLPINNQRLSRFNAVQRPRVDQWVGWSRRTRGVVPNSVRLDQAQVNAAGMKISGNSPDFQLTLEGGRTYTLPNGAQIEVLAGKNQRVYVEFDPFKGGRSTPHAKNLLGDDPHGIVVLDVFDDNGLINSITFNPS